MLSLATLSGYLKRYYGEKVIILINEYDTAIESEFHSSFYKEVVFFFQNFFSAGLKGNTSLKLVVLTGIVSVSKESMFSGCFIYLREFLLWIYARVSGFFKGTVSDTK